MSPAAVKMRRCGGGRSGFLHHTQHTQLRTHRHTHRQKHTETHTQIDTTPPLRGVGGDLLKDQHKLQRDITGRVDDLRVDTPGSSSIKTPVTSWTNVYSSVIFNCSLPDVLLTFPLCDAKTGRVTGAPSSPPPPPPPSLLKPAALASV